MADALDSTPFVDAETRAQWREWLLAHSDSEKAAWLVSWKKATGKPAISYDDAVSEALTVGWVDSRTRALDAERTLLYFTRRNPASAWSRTNKVRVERLRADGLMTDAGEAVIAAAQLSGSWALLDDVERLIVPDDLRDALDRYPNAAENWGRFPPSTRRRILEWIVLAKRPGTRQARVAETALRASENERAGEPRPRP
jgi:uncharacterized protein YdeI (YjbR/CyaY-like superfamily)